MPLWFQQYSSMIEGRLRAIEAAIGPRQLGMSALLHQRKIKISPLSHGSGGLRY